MKIISFSVKNYRSISDANKLHLKDYTVLIGPNNEGKSNILKALGLCISVITNYRMVRRISSIRRLRLKRISNEITRYYWEIDYPLSLQKKNPDGKSEFLIEVELSPTELLDFKNKIKNKLSSNLKILVSIGNDSYPKIEIIIKGKGKKSLNSKIDKIINFINDRIIFSYIGSLRTSEKAIEIVENILRNELQLLTYQKEYELIKSQIKKLQKPIINSISRTLTKTVSEFIPDVKKIYIENKESLDSLISSACDFYVDDGVRTELSQKGDGVISLTTISLLKYAMEKELGNKNLMLLIEEPEVHLHSKAIEGFKSVLNDLSKNNQVIITTHSSVIIDRANIKNNILVKNHQAVHAKNLAEIRDSLGIKLSENLSSADLALLVEGEEDVLILKYWLSLYSPKIKSALNNGQFIIDSLGGGSNLCYKITMYKAILCNIHCYLDNDEAGRSSVQDALDKKLLKNSDYNLSICKGVSNSEIEDLIDINIYSKLLLENYGIDVRDKEFKSKKIVWSDRLKNIYNKSKMWDKRIEMDIKYNVIDLIIKSTESGINDHKKTSIDALIAALEKKLINI